MNRGGCRRDQNGGPGGRNLEQMLHFLERDWGRADWLTSAGRVTRLVAAMISARVARFVFGCGTSGADAFFSDSVAVFIRFS